MKTQRQFLSVAWLAACALLLLSACRGPTPIAGRVTETAAGVTSNTPLPASTPLPSGAVPTRVVVIEQKTPTPTILVSPTQSPRRVGTATATPVSPNTPDAPTPPATDTPVPDDVKPGRPTETPAVLNITPPEISGYSLQQKPDGGWTYMDKTGKEVAHTVTYSWEGLDWKKPVQRGALVVSDEKLMAYLLKTASEGREKSELPLFPLPFNPKGLELQEVNVRGYTVITIMGGLIQEVFQPFPKESFILLNDFKSFKGMDISPTGDWGLRIYASNFVSSLKPLYQTKMAFLAPLASNFSSGGLPSLFGVPGASALMTIGSSSGGKSLALGNFASVGGFTVVAGH